MTVSQDSPLDREVRERVHRKFHFYQHLALFIPALAVLLAVDLLHHLLVGGREPFVPWVVGIWGTILAGHSLYAFVLGEWLGTEAQRRAAERELRRRQASAN